jgi:hypothetical protein
MSYIIPKEELTLTDQKAFRSMAMDRAVARAISLKIAGVASELNVRAFENILDAGTALEQYNTAALAAVGTAYSVFQTVGAPTLAANKLAVFYGVAIETTPLPVSLLTFRSGGVNGNIIAEFDLEQLATCDVVAGYFTEPVVIDPTRMFAIQATARTATGVLARIQLKAFIVEPVGQRIA